MQAHDPSRISVTDHVLFTENTIPLRLGQGLWATMSGEGSYKLYFDDPDDGQAGFIGTIRENGIGAILVLRLKISRGRISEAEMIVRRNPSDAAALETQGPPETLWGEPLSSGDRPSRQELIRPTDLYFEGVVHADGNRVPFAQDCSRILDGTRDINNPEDRSLMFGSFNPSALDCRENLNALGLYLHHLDRPAAIPCHRPRTWHGVRGLHVPSSWGMSRPWTFPASAP